MAIVISIVLFSALMGAITVYGYRRYARPARVLERLGSPVLEAEGGLGATWPRLDRRKSAGSCVSSSRSEKRFRFRPKTPASLAAI